MLYLTRHTGECIIIEDSNGEITKIKICEFSNKGVTLSFDAPKCVKIDRQELFFEKEASKKEQGRDIVCSR